MITWRAGTVDRITRQTSEVVELIADVDGRPVKALAYRDLVGEPGVGDRVLLNVTALDRGLGTGGFALVIAIPDRLPADPPRGPGHLVKARYTPLQTMVLGADEQESATHEMLRDADSLTGMPVVAADLHSALPAIIAGLRHDAPTLRVAYVMTDGSALPIAFSRTVAALRDADWLVGSVTVGQAYGGDLEAVNIHTGLLAARLVLGADVAIVAQGPGNLGTGTRWGFSGTSAGEAINAAAVLGGRPVASLRVSGADQRERHRGVSHHSITAYGRVALCEAELALPALDEHCGPEFADLIRGGVRDIERLSQHRMRAVEVPTDGLYDALLACPVALSTMGRGLEQDPAAFLTAAVAGRLSGSTTTVPS